LVSTLCTISYRFVNSFRAGPGCNCLPSRSCSKDVWHVPLLSVQWMNSWWWTEERSETCRVSWQNRFVKLVHLVGFDTKKSYSYFRLTQGPSSFHLRPYRTKISVPSIIPFEKCLLLRETEPESIFGLCVMEEKKRRNLKEKLVAPSKLCLCLYKCVIYCQESLTCKTNNVPSNWLLNTQITYCRQDCVSEPSEWRAESAGSVSSFL